MKHVPAHNPILPIAASENKFGRGKGHEKERGFLVGLGRTWQERPCEIDGFLAFSQSISYSLSHDAPEIPRHQGHVPDGFFVLGKVEGLPVWHDCRTGEHVGGESLN